MPIYTYSCKDCGVEEEILQKLNETSTESQCTCCSGELVRCMSTGYFRGLPTPQFDRKD